MAPVRRAAQRPSCAANSRKSAAACRSRSLRHQQRTDVQLKEWTIMEGSLGLKVNLSDQSIEVA
jgi:hypothetical protein